MNGPGSACVVPSTVTPRSSIASRKADCVRGVTGGFTNIQGTSLLDENRTFHRELISNISIDQETGGILEAEAYDRQGRLLKVFEPKSFKKVNGQWELQEMEIRNVQTSSRTRIEFAAPAE